jgi:hypothetical protein
MAVDHIRYDILAQEALRGVVRTVLTDAAKNGLPGEHHFKITFATTAPGVRLSERMRKQYPEEMTIILQHQFWDLDVGDDEFEVGLSFGGVAERLVVPFEAVTAFFDPAVQFGFQFETLDAEGSGDAAASTDAAENAPGAETGAKSATKTGATSNAAGPRAVESKKPGVVPVATAKAEAPPPAPSPSKPDGDKDGAGAGGQVVRLDRFRKK